MARVIDIPQARRMLSSRVELMRAGRTERDLRHALESGGLVRVRRGWYVVADAWAGLWPEGRHLLQVLAGAEEMTGGAGVYSHASAAVLHAVPLYRARFDRVHLTLPSGMQASSGPGVMRHVDRLDETDVVVVDGLRCTSPDRTAFDLARTASPECAVSAVDAVLGRVAVAERVQDEQASRRWRAGMRSRAAGAGAVRGARQARWMIEFADGRAELPLESVSRLQLHRLGFGRPRLQVPVPGRGGRTFWIDLGLDDVDAWAEVDGAGKYRDEAMRSGRSVEDVVLDEKRREDWIRGTTGRRFVRWGDREAASAASLGRHLASFGILPPR